MQKIRSQLRNCIVLLKFMKIYKYKVTLLFLITFFLQLIPATSCSECEKISNSHPLEKQINEDSNLLEKVLHEAKANQKYLLALFIIQRILHTRKLQRAFQGNDFYVEITEQFLEFRNRENTREKNLTKYKNLCALRQKIEIGLKKIILKNETIFGRYKIIVQNIKGKEVVSWGVIGCHLSNSTILNILIEQIEGFEFKIFQNEGEKSIFWIMVFRKAKNSNICVEAEKPAGSRVLLAQHPRPSRFSAHDPR